MRQHPLESPSTNSEGLAGSAGWARDFPASAQGEDVTGISISLAEPVLKQGAKLEGQGGRGQGARGQQKQKQEYFSNLLFVNN